ARHGGQHMRLRSSGRTKQPVGVDIRSYDQTVLVKEDAFMIAVDTRFLGFAYLLNAYSITAYLLDAANAPYISQPRSMAEARMRPRLPASALHPERVRGPAP